MIKRKFSKLALLIFTVFFTVTSYAQKQKKTYDSEKFVKKIQFSLTPDLIGKWLPDDAALQYIAEVSGRSLGELSNEKRINSENIKKNAQDFTQKELVYILDRSEVQVKQESPVKIADILMYCHTKQESFVIKLSNCVQTNTSWYLGDAIIPEGDGFERAVTERADKKPSKLGVLLIKGQEAQKNADNINKQNLAYTDSLRQVRPGYETKSNTFYNYDLADFPLNGYYIKNNGEKVAAIIAYQKPQFLIGLSNALFICKQATGEKVDALNASSDPNFKEWVKYDDIKAFYVADQLFARNSDGNFTIIITEGAIHTSASMKLMDEESQFFKVFPVTQKLNGQKFGSATQRITEAALLNMMTDAPEIIQGYKNGEYPLNEAEIRYNIWYEENNPGTINYFFGKDYEITKKSSVYAQQKVTEYDKEIIAAADEANRAPKLDKFAGRPQVASASVASAKPEVTVKKESFKDRLNRIKTDGNKVGVLVTSKNLVINPNPFSEGITKARVMGSYGPLSDLDVLAKTTADQLNSGFGIDVFEAVDYSKIPVKDGKYGKMDDWWATKYKIIVFYELSPSYNAYYKTINAESGERKYHAQMKVDSEMIVMAAEEIKPDRLRYVTSSPKSWGYYRSDIFIGPSETDYNIIQELKSAINPPSDQIVIEEIVKSQKEYLNKFVKKKSK
jgi:hypothetical protein